MRLFDYELTIPEGSETEAGYVQISHGGTYTLAVENFSQNGCEVRVSINGAHVGTWRLTENARMSVERPVYDAGKFTFNRGGTIEAEIGGHCSDQNQGLITAIFMPEASENARPRPVRAPAAAGSGGMTAPNDLQPASAFVTINLRLVAPGASPRPEPSRASPVPPSVA